MPGGSRAIGYDANQPGGSRGTGTFYRRGFRERETASVGGGHSSPAARPESCRRRIHRREQRRTRCPVTEATTEKRLGSQTPTRERFLTRAASFYGRKRKTKPNSKIVSIGTTASSLSTRTAGDQVSGYGNGNRKRARAQTPGWRGFPGVSALRFVLDLAGFI